MYKKNKAYIIWIIILALLYMIFRNTLFGAIFFSAIVMMLISIIIAKLLVRSLEIKIDVDKDIIDRGNKALFNINIYNKSIFPSNKVYVKIQINNLFFAGKEECYVNIPVSIKGKDIICSDVKCEYVGNVVIEATEIIVMDYLGLVKYGKNISSEAIVKVVPSEINYMLPINEAYEEAEDGDKKIDTLDSTEIKDIREYKNGESLKRIHWKLSLKYDEYMIKESESSVEANSIILVDLFQENYDILNDIIEVTYSLVKSFINTLGKTVTVNWYDASKEAYIYYDINSVEDVDMLLEYIYNTRFGKEQGMVCFSYLLKNDCVNEDELIYITVLEDKQEGRTIGIYNDKVVLKCI